MPDDVVDLVGAESEGLNADDPSARRHGVHQLEESGRVVADDGDPLALPDAQRIEPGLPGPDPPSSSAYVIVGRGAAGRAGSSTTATEPPQTASARYRKSLTVIGTRTRGSIARCRTSEP